MSQENVELVRAGFAAYSRGDLDALTQLYDPDVVFETLLLGTHHGNEAIRLLYEENRKTLSGYTIDPIELIDAGDKVVRRRRPSTRGATESSSKCGAGSTTPTPSKPPGCRSRRCRRRTSRSCDGPTRP
jgi:ketosteroid isomerase-like protein